jgi:hypothetical protein
VARVSRRAGSDTSTKKQVPKLRLQTQNNHNTSTIVITWSSSDDTFKPSPARPSSQPSSYNDMLPRPSPAHSPARPSSQQQPSSAQPSSSHNNNAMLPPPTTSIDRVTPHAAQLYYRGHYSPSAASLLLLLLLGRRSSPVRLHNTSTIVITWSSSDDTFKGCPFEATRSVYFPKKHSLLLRKVQECLGSNLAVAASTQSPPPKNDY